MECTKKASNSTLLVLIGEGRAQIDRFDSDEEFGSQFQFLRRVSLSVVKQTRRSRVIMKAFLIILLAQSLWFECYAFGSFTRLDWAASAVRHRQHHPHSPSDDYNNKMMTMKIRVGILGMPNIGKSTLFNALAKESSSKAEMANYPFCTIDPNRATVPVPDPVLEALGAFSKHPRTVPATIEWWDVAGLVKNAHRGEGLGNQFLGTLRSCSVLIHLVRVFPSHNGAGEEESIIHVDGSIDPVRDIETIHLELILADDLHIQRRLERTNVPDIEREALERIRAVLVDGKPARSASLTQEQISSLSSMGLLTLKPMIYAFNVDDVDFTFGRDAAEEHVKDILERCGSIVDNDDSDTLWTLVSAKLEQELSTLSTEEQTDYWASLGIEDANSRKGMADLLSINSLPRLVQKSLGLSTVYTGPGVPAETSQTTKAHFISTQKKSWTAHEMAGRLHGEIQKGFIKAEVALASSLLEHNNYPAAKEAGIVRTEGRDYVMRDQDVLLVKWRS